MIALAIILVFVLLVPAMFVGGIVKIIYIATAGHFLASGGLLNWLTSGWLDRIALAWFPNLLHGAVAGAAAVGVASLILKRVSFETPAYAVSSIVVLLSIIGGGSSFARQGFELGLVELVSNTLGIVLGLFIAAKSVDSQPHRNQHSALQENNSRQAPPESRPTSADHTEIEDSKVVSCQNCGTKLRLPKGKEGIATCPTCRERFHVNR